jgi:hypothetical protein
VRIWRSEVRRDRPCGFVEAVGQVSSVALNRFGMSAHREKEHGAVLSEEAAAATKALRATQGRLRYIT